MTCSLDCVSWGLRVVFAIASSALKGILSRAGMDMLILDVALVILTYQPRVVA